eukprot:12172227-Alexandrium_andersonii.AAC.1
MRRQLPDISVGRSRSPLSYGAGGNRWGPGAESWRMDGCLFAVFMRLLSSSSPVGVGRNVEQNAALACTARLHPLAGI